MQGVAGVVLLYNPDEGVPDRIKSYLHHLDVLYVIDNSEKELSFRMDSPKIVYLHDGKNNGIAARLNQAANLSINKSCDWLLTMDQDSSFTQENLNNYLHCVSRYPHFSDISVFGVQFHNPHSQSSVCSAEESLHLITSGSLVNLKLFTEVGGFDENLFIDQVDYDYTFRSHLKGRKTIRFANVFLQHSLGKESVHISFKNLKKTKRSLHAPIRIYYMARNYLYMRRKYAGSFPAEISHMKKDLINRLKNNFLYNPKRLSVVTSFISGIIDYRRNKMGKK